MDPVVALLSVQVALTAIAVIALLVLGRALVRSLDDVTALLDSVRTMIDLEVRPAVRDVRATLATAESAVAKASSVLQSAEPAISAVGTLAGRVVPNANPLWLDAARLGLGLLRAVKNGQRQKSTMGEKQDVQQ